MGFRFYRRINFGSGFGINLGKRGASWSIRTKGGSFGSKGYSVRTPIKGLSYQKRFKKSYSKNSSYNNYSTETKSRSSNADLILGIIIIVALCIYFTTILWIIIAIIVVAILYSLFLPSTRPQKSNQINTTIETPNPTSSAKIQKPIQAKTLRTTSAIKIDSKACITKAEIVIDKLLNQSQLITLENICIDIDDFIDEVSYEKNSNTNLLQQYSTDQIRQLILHDICNIFHLLQTSLNDNSIEREIWFSIVFHFSAKSISYTTYDELIIRKQIQKMVAPDFFVYSDIDKNPFTALLFLKEQNRPLYLKYKRLLNDYVTLITTIDFDITINKRKLIHTMQRQ
jgi:hypothetical protein